MPAEYTVLLVDDEKVIRDGCSRLLSHEGFRVLIAANGQEALELLASNPVDVIICDLKMPVMDALEVLQETKARYPDVPVIIITGHGTLESALECMKKGAHDFVTKPFRADHLVTVTKNALEEQHRRKRQLE